MFALPDNIGPVFFGMPLGLWALLGIVPLLILYLIRPRPKKMELPSLMFFLKAGGKSIVQSFFRTIMRDLLFLLQLVLCLALLFIPAEPYTNMNINMAAQHTVFVIDTSASSQAATEGGTRLEFAINTAKGMLGKTNTIILAKGQPELLAREISATDAKKALDGIKPTDTTSRIGEAMLMAGQALEGDGIIVAISDFDNTDGVTPSIAKTALESRGKTVKMINTAKGPVDNIGIVDLAIGEDSSVAYVRNYKKEEASVTLKIGADAKQLKIAADGTEPVRFTTPPGVSELKLEPGDGYPADDIATISAPPEEKIRVLLITNEPSRFIKSALTASPRIDLAISEPPIISKEKFDVYVFDHTNTKAVLPGTYQDIIARVQQGAGAIVTAHQGIGSVAYGKLLPITITGDGNNTYVRSDQDITLTRNLEFGNVKSYIQASPVDGAISVATAGDNSTIIAIKNEGAGMVAYYGIMEDASEFKLQPDYPIFWQNLIKVMAQRIDVRELNKRAGETLTLDSETAVEAPDGRKLKDLIITLENRGVYVVGDRRVAVNGLDPRESGLAFHDLSSGSEAAGGRVTEQRQFNWEMALFFIAAVFLVLEILFLKIRGDI